MDILEPIWRTKTETASRVRGRVEAILDYARARKWRAGENPARWKGHLDALLPARSKVAKVKHHAAVPWRELPGLYQRIAEQVDVSALALRYVILTAARTGEILGAPAKGEIDTGAKTHIIPPERMKAGREHRIPLSDEALVVLEKADAIRTGDWLFNEGAVAGRPLSDMALLEKVRGCSPPAQRRTGCAAPSGTGRANMALPANLPRPPSPTRCGTRPNVPICAATCWNRAAMSMPALGRLPDGALSEVRG